MAGIQARQGFQFQDAILAEKVLEHHLRLRQAIIDATDLPPERLFGIEAAPGKDTATEWDILTVVGAGTDQERAFLEEVKGGEIPRDDRQSFWRRLRTSWTASRRPVAVLTVDADNLPAQAELWRGLAVAAASITSASSGPDRVSTSRDLAHEALYCLTTTDPAFPGSVTPPLTVLDAHEVLRTFQFRTRGRQDVTQAIIQHVTELQFEIAAADLALLLSGAIGARAAATSQEEHLFTTSEIIQSLSALDALLKTSPDQLRLWHELTASSSARLSIGQASPAHHPGLPYQDWSAIHAHVSQSLESEPCLVITGHGGLGKTTLVERWALMQIASGSACVWIDASSVSTRQISDFAGALALGAFSARRSQKELIVCIDALESTDGSPALALQFLSGLASSARTHRLRVVATARHHFFETISDRQTAAPWKTIAISTWPSSVVESILRSHAGRQCTPDLVDVLRTPLLLDLFLRTFGHGESVPDGLQTRHAVLDAYYRRRVIGDGNGAIDRRHFLYTVGSAEANGQSWHRIPSPSVDRLVSEGLFVAQAGAYRFRHPLLRDFVTMIWALEEAAASGDFLDNLVPKMDQIPVSLVRFGAWRQILEAFSSRHVGVASTLLPSGVSLNDLISRLGAKSDWILLAAELLGDFDFPSIDMNNLGHRIQNRQFGARLIKFATLGRNIRWLSTIAALPETLAWATSATWIDGQFLIELAQLLSTSEAQALSANTRRSVALRIREWSNATSISADLNQSYGWGWSVVIRSVFLTLDSSQTLHWVRQKAGISWRTREIVLELLPLFLAQRGADDRTIDDAVLVQIYLQSAGFEFRDNVLTSSETSTDNSDWHRIEIGLLGLQNSGQGLLNTRPDLFLPIAFAFVSTEFRDEEEKRIRRQESIRSKVAARLAQIQHDDSAEKSPADNLHAALKKQCSPCFDRSSALGDLENDSRMLRRSGESGALGQLLQQFDELASTRDEDFLRKIFWPPVNQSRSAAVRTQFLQTLVKDPRQFRCPEMVVALLSDSRLYHCLESHFAIWNAIKASWLALSPSNQAVIIDNIRALKFTPSMDGAYAIGPLLDAVPENDRPADLLPFLELYRLHGWPPRPADPNLRHVSAGPFTPDPDDLYEGFLKIPNIDTRCEEQWRTCAREKIVQVPDPSDEQVDAAFERYSILIQNCLPTPETTEKAPWILQDLTAFVDFARRNEKAKKRQLPAADVASLLQWALSIATSQPEGTVNSDRKPLVGSEFSIDSGDIWPAAIDLMSAALTKNSEFLEPFLDLMLSEVARISPKVSPIVLKRLFSSIEPWQWDKATQGKEILSDLLTRPESDPVAASHGIRLLCCFDAKKRQEILTLWLTDGAHIKLTKEGLEFIHAIGAYLGGGALSRDDKGEYHWPHHCAGKLLHTRSSSGVIASDEAYRVLVVGIAYGAKTAAATKRAGAIPAPQDYATLVASCWEALRSLSPSRRTSEKDDRFSLFVFHSILAAAKSHDSNGALADPQNWWSALESVACEIVRSGSDFDVAHILSGLRHKGAIGTLGQERLRSIVTAIDERLIGSGQVIPDTRYAVEFLGNLALKCASDDPLVAEICRILERWPVTSGDVLEVKRQVRLHGGVS